MPDTKRVLGIYAHPDDADVGAGGTLAQFAANGAEVNLLLVTSGDAGGFDRENHRDMTSVRQAEQRRSANALGIKDVVFLSDYLDGYVSATQDLVRDIVRHIRIGRPQVIITTSPAHNWQNFMDCHPDHREVGEAVLRAVYPAARNPFAFPELLHDEELEPWTVDEVWLQGHPEANHVVTLSAEDMSRKIAAVRSHSSQFASMSEIEEFVWQRSTAVAADAHLAEASHAESFFVYRTAGHYPLGTAARSHRSVAVG